LTQSIETDTRCRIHQLPPEVVNKIAAGEVVERPASVVKELLENSVDAAACRVDIDIRQGGAELIRVVDDGEGIHRDDLPLAVTSHATSKIDTADDLFRVNTMGFRGEALASIAAVSRMRLRSRPRESDCGYELTVDGGTVSEVKPCGCAAGTTIEIRQLFGNTPVRRKFLRTAATEFGHISEQVTRVALAHPRLHLTLAHNDRTVHDLPATDELTARLERFFGSELVEQLIPVDTESDGVRLWGYVAHPSQSKSTRKGQYLFLNGRWIQDRALQHALGEAYRGLLMTGRYPIAFLFLEMPADSVDVNVHPTKAEVRFRNGGTLYRQLLAALRNRFLSMDLNSGMHLPRQPRASQTPQTPTPEQQHKLQLDFARWAKEELAAALSPYDEQAPEAQSPDAPGATGGLSASAQGGWGRSAAEPPATESPESAPHTSSDPDTGVNDSPPAAAEAGTASVGRGTEPQGWPADEASRFASTTPNGPLPRVMQVHDCYLVVETGDGLTVIDQHALHERILYEQLRQRVLNSRVESQQFLVPQPMELAADEASILRDYGDLLAELGYAVEEFGGNSLLLSAYPAMLSQADHPRLLRDIAEQLLSAGGQPGRRDLLDGLLHSMACRGAIKAGQRLSPEEMQTLLEQRHLVDDSHHCPHGRPTALVLSRQELDRQFGRLG